MANSGYKINTYIDVNPNSPTYQTTRTERVLDTTSCPIGQADWRLVERYCETSSSGTNTGNLVTVEEDVNPTSPTYHQRRETITHNESFCPPQSTEPLWEEISGSYCEVDYYEPAHVQGNTGYKMVHYRDSNYYSPTYRTEKWERELSEDCPAPDTSPQIEIMSESCVMEVCRYTGENTTNGYKLIYGLDKNVYSSTYNTYVSEEIMDTATCPFGCSIPPAP